MLILTRRMFQIAIVAAAAVTGLRFATGWSLTSVEKYCPFGGLETLYAFLSNQRFSCAAGELNLTLFLALLGLTVLARKSFCSWVCPFGTISEGLAALGRRLFRRSRRSPDGGYR
ncbi:MAG TPA: 4Fe-4S binding protein [Acidobacteriota bacterium]|nr:4Fe-4S binding protein [Acidobacteriota bacterium]